MSVGHDRGHYMNRLDSNQRDNLKELLQVIVSLQDTAEAWSFFNDLCTMQELLQFSQRLQVAKLLKSGETYESIRSQIPVSTTTITRINTTLQYGSGGYRAALERLEQDQDSSG